jgi:hypothetical protein
MSHEVSVPRTSNVFVVVLLSLAVAGSLGPHLLMVGYKAVGARPPGVLNYFCLLHHSGKARPSAAVGDLSIRLRR